MKVLGVLLAILMFLPAAMATSVFVTPISETSNNIFFDELAQFTITIDNTDNQDVVFTWSLNPVEWVIESKNSVRVNANSEQVINLSVRPRPSNFRGPGFYVVPLNVDASNGESYTEQVIINIRSVNDLGNYRPAVALGASVASEIDPREDVSVQVQVRNRNILEIDELTLVIESANFYKEDSFALSALEEKTLEYRFDIDPLVQPGEYDLNMKLLYQNSTLSRVQRFYDVISYSVVERETSEKKGTFSSTQVSVLTNKGNIPKEIATNLDIPLLKRMFTSVDVEANSVELNSRFSWTIQLQADESATVVVTENYTAVPIVLLILIASIILYFVLRSPIVMQKQIIVTGKDEEGISEMKVRIYLRNRTAKAFFNIRVLDKAPNIAHVQESDGLGVLEPTKIIRTEKKGTIIKWDFDSLEAYEERIVTYTIKSKLKIIGNLNLPAVKVKYETVKGDERTAESGRAVIGEKK